MSIATYRDAWGIPHLRAGDAGELAYAQGHNAALDRAWQIEVERHRAQGTSAAFLGSGSLDWDRFARRARLDDTARRCFRRLEPTTAAWLGGYVAGVNAGLAEGARRAPEFATTGLNPGRWWHWSPIGIWLSTHILFAGFPAKLWREQVARTLGEDSIGIFATDGPGTTGSNGWLVTGELTTTGAPLIAGDPHRIIEAPGVYQQIRLSCPEYDVIGLAVPGVPGVAHFGHTGQVAWGITNAMADYQDLYVERLRRRGGRVQALGPDGWEDTKVHLETIEVAAREGTAGEGTAGEGTAGEAGNHMEVRIEVIETERGPVLIGGPDQEIAISLRHPPRVNEDIGFDALPALLRATRVTDVDRAADRWVEPCNVVLAADTEGGLLHRVAGRVPARHPANRLRVVPAWDPAYRWRGSDEPAPRADVEAGGVVVMANERGISAPLGVEFAPPHRAERIAALLGGGPPDGHERTGPAWSADGMELIHTDTLLPTGRLLEVLGRLDGLGPEAARLRDRLLGWDRRMSAGSTEAQEYAAVRASVVRRLAGHPALTVLDDHAWLPACIETFAPWLALLPRVAYALDTLLTAGPVPSQDVPGIVRAAVEDAATGQAGTGGSEAASVPWGETHRLAPWQALPDPGRRWPGVGGDHDCVLSTSSIPGVTDRCVRGPAARYVWDLARRDGSRWVVPLGASGVPGDPHHLDQLPLWRRGELLPVITDWSLLTLESEMEAQIAMQPVPGRVSVHTRTVEGFGTVHVVPMDPCLDLDLIHGWVTEDRARFWGMLEHSRERIREIYEYLDSLTTHHVYLLHRGDVPVALFQTYDPAADPIGDHYDVQPGDIGVHTLVGPVAGRPEAGFTGALLSVFLEFVLADPSRRRVVAEPDARNDRAIARFLRTGFTLGPRIRLPNKPAQLVFLPLGATPPPTR